MKNLAFWALLILSTLIFSCKPCYNCDRKCGTCTKGLLVVAGCDGDSSLNGFSVDSWKAYFESQGYTCSYSNPPAVEVCGSDDKSVYSAKGYTCTTK